MIERKTAVASAVVGAAVIISILLTFVFHFFFGLGELSFVSFPLTLIGTILAVRQFLSEPDETTEIYHIEQKVSQPTVIEQSDGGWDWSERTD